MSGASAAVMADDAPVLDVRGLAVRLPPGAERAHAVREVSFAVRKGELVCLLGESGSGKSVIAQSVMGLLPRGLPAVAGEVRLEGENLLAARPERLRRLRGTRMSMVFQEPATALNPVMRCGAQIDELLACHTALPAAERRRRILEVLAQVRLPDPARMLASYPHQLSGGQRQRIMIAMALILEPALLVADEPTTALDVTTQAEILALIRLLQRDHGTAVLYITHDFGVAAEIADRVAVLRQGELIEQGSAEEVLSRPRHAYTRMLLAAVPSLVPPERAPLATREEVLSAHGLGKTYAGGTFLARGKEVVAARDIELSVHRGETVGIVGESGSGKSTVARCVARLIEASAGRLALDGASVPLAGSVAREFRRRVQIVFQDPYRSLNPRRTVGAAIVEGPMNFGVPRAKARLRAQALMGLVRLSPGALERYPHEFSGGQRQRLCIARALALEPHLLIADEAVSALDVSVQAQILELLADIQRRLRLALLFITHDLRVAAQICDRVVVMQHGRIVEQGPVGAIFRAPRHPYTRALLAAAPGRRFDFALPRPPPA